MAPTKRSKASGGEYSHQDNKRHKDKDAPKASLSSLPKELVNGIALRLPPSSQISFKLTNKFNLDAGLSLHQLTVQAHRNPWQWFLLDTFIGISKLFGLAPWMIACSYCMGFHESIFFSQEQLQRPDTERRCLGSYGRIFLLPGIYLCFSQRKFYVSPRIDASEHGLTLLHASGKVVGHIHVSLDEGPLKVFTDVQVLHEDGSGFNKFWDYFIDNKQDKASRLLRNYLKRISYPICPHKNFKDCFGPPERAFSILEARFNQPMVKWKQTVDRTIDPPFDQGEPHFVQLINKRRPSTINMAQPSATVQRDSVHEDLDEQCFHCGVRTQISIDFEYDCASASQPTWISDHRFSISFRTVREFRYGRNLANQDWMRQMTQEDEDPLNPGYPGCLPHAPRDPDTHPPPPGCNCDDELRPIEGVDVDSENESLASDPFEFERPRSGTMYEFFDGVTGVHPVLRQRESMICGCQYCYSWRQSSPSIKPWLAGEDQGWRRPQHLQDTNC